MFNEKTVFILGAGASWHYNCPTGEDLIALVQEKAGWLAEYWSNGGPRELLKTDPPNYFRELDQDPSKALDIFRTQCNGIQSRLRQVNPLVIDYFLGHNQTLQDIGKLLISYVLLEREKEYLVYVGNRNHRHQLFRSPQRKVRQECDELNVELISDDWCRFIVDKMISNCRSSADLLNNKVSFVTFNYDVTLEHRIYKALHPNEFFDPADKESFFKKKDLVFHVYGQIRASPFEDQLFGNFSESNQTGAPPLERKNDLDKAWKAAKTIYTIPEDKGTQVDILEQAKQKIKSAKNIFILGYGFDENNSEKLDLKNSLTDKNKDAAVYFTNFKDMNRINRRVSRLLLGADDGFRGMLIMPRGPSQRWHYEKSIKSVHDALAQDFELS